MNPTVIVNDLIDIFRRRRWLGVALFIFVTLGSVASAQTVLSHFTRPDTARFRLLSEDGLAAPDGGSFIPTTKIWTVADRATGTCFVWLFSPGGTAMTPIACPQ
jgi:hypothetical protein